MSDPYLDTLLEQRFPHLTADAWKEMLFTTLRAYEGHRDLFFMPELYDFYEYFAGKRILGLSETQADRYAFFRALVEEITGKPFLWGLSEMHW